MLPAFSSLFHREHAAADNSSRKVPTLKLDPLLPSRGQPTGYENDSALIFDRLLDDIDPSTNQDGDERVAYLPTIDVDENQDISDGFNLKASDNVRVLDVSISLAVVPDPGREGSTSDGSGNAMPADFSTSLLGSRSPMCATQTTEDPLGVVAHAPPIKVAASCTDHDPNAQCAYRKGKCPQLRAVKKNGALHTLCAFHREKSCANQKAFDGKRRKRSEDEEGKAIKKTKKTEKAKQQLPEATTSQSAEKKKTISKKKSERIDSNMAKRAARRKPAGQKRKRTLSRGRPARTRSATTKTAQSTASLDANAPESTPLEHNKPQQRKHEVEQDDRDLFEAFTLVLDSKQLSRAKKAAITQFLHDTMLSCEDDAAIAGCLSPAIARHGMNSATSQTNSRSVMWSIVVIEVRKEAH